MDKKPTKEELIEIFKDTENFIENNVYLNMMVEESRSGTKVYHEKYRTAKEARFKNICNVVVNKNKSFQDASKCEQGRVGVLNFANAIHPGGAVKSGSRAQEESLCRCSTLYPCINFNDKKDVYSDYIYNGYYKHNYDLQKATSRVIYTPNVLVFKSDDDYPSLLVENRWYKVDILTCAANNQNVNYLNDNELYLDMYEKISNIINVAIDNEIDILILGAFGCGAFGCNPQIVSKAFYNVIKEYSYYFKEVRFAIYCNEFETENYKTFEKTFCGSVMNNKQSSVEEIIGDALTTDADILLHQVNLQGYMGGGIAKQIAIHFPNVEKDYMNYENKVLGEVVFVKTDKYVVGNCFSQKENFDTDYEALKACLDKVVDYLRENNLKSVAIPYKYGCGIANGDWDTVYDIFKEKLKDFIFKIYKLK